MCLYYAAAVKYVYSNSILCYFGVLLLQEQALFFLLVYSLFDKLIINMQIQVIKTKSD